MYFHLLVWQDNRTTLEYIPPAPPFFNVGDYKIYLQSGGGVVLSGLTGLRKKVEIQPLTNCVYFPGTATYISRNSYIYFRSTFLKSSITRRILFDGPTFLSIKIGGNCWLPILDYFFLKSSKITFPQNPKQRGLVGILY